jgi:hypothetical protein
MWWWFLAFVVFRSVTVLFGLLGQYLHKRAKDVEDVSLALNLASTCMSVLAVVTQVLDTIALTGFGVLLLTRLGLL